MQNEITELRNQVRTLKRIVYGFGCLLVAGIVVGATSLQSVPDVIQAKKFQVVNDKGKVVSAWHYDFAGGMFELMDATGNKIFLTLECLNDIGGLLRTQNGKGQALVALGVTTDGNGVVATENGKGQTLVELTATTDGEGLVQTENGKGQALVTLSATEGGRGMVTTQNGKGQTLVKLTATTDGEGMVQTENGKGQQLVQLGATEGGAGAVVTQNGKGQTLVSLGSYTGLNGGYVETFTKKGISTSEIP